LLQVRNFTFPMTCIWYLLVPLCVVTKCTLCENLNKFSDFFPDAKFAPIKRNENRRLKLEEVNLIRLIRFYVEQEELFKHIEVQVGYKTQFNLNLIDWKITRVLPKGTIFQKEVYFYANFINVYNRYKEAINYTFSFPSGSCPRIFPGKKVAYKPLKPYFFTDKRMEWQTCLLL